VILVKNGQPVDGFPGALPEGQLRAFLKQHGIEPAAVPQPVEEIEFAAAVVDPHAEVIRLRAAAATASEQEAPKIKLDLAIALLNTGAAHEAEQLIDALPANLATDDRAIRAHAHLRFIALLKDAPPTAVLEAAIATDPGDLRARHLLGVQRLIGGDAAGGLDQFIEMLRRERGFADGLPKRSLIDAFRMVEDTDLVGAYRRKMSSLLF
jgi:putative thioredoxin